MLDDLDLIVGKNCSTSSGESLLTLVPSDVITSSPKLRPLMEHLLKVIMFCNLDGNYISQNHRHWSVILMDVVTGYREFQI